MPERGRMTGAEAEAFSGIVVDVDKLSDTFNEYSHESQTRFSLSRAAILVSLPWRLNATTLRVVLHFAQTTCPHKRQ